MPYGQLTQFNGKIYGLTQKGGNYGYGTIYELDHGNITVLYHFTGYKSLGKLLIDQNKIIFLEGYNLIGIDLTTRQVQALQTYSTFFSNNARLMKASDGYYYTLNDMKFIRINSTDYTLEELTNENTGITGLRSEITEYNGKLYGFTNCACTCLPSERGIFSFDLSTLQVGQVFSEEYRTTNFYFDNRGMELSEYNDGLYGISRYYSDIMGETTKVYSIANNNSLDINDIQPHDESFGQKFLYDTNNGTMLYLRDNSIKQFDTNNQPQVIFNFPMTRAFQAYGSLSLLDTAGLEDILADKISVYPNPANNLVYFKNTSGYEIINFSITDMQGKQVMAHKSFSGNTIDISKLATGIYNIQIQLEQGFIFNKKIIKH